MGTWKANRKRAKFNYHEKKIKRLLSKQFECPMCGRSGNIISLWGHSISKDQGCDLYELQGPISRLQTLVMMIAYGIPVPDEIRNDITKDLLEEMDLMEILAQPDLAALVVLSGLGMSDTKDDVSDHNSEEPAKAKHKVQLGEEWNDWDNSADYDRDQN